MSRVWAVAGLLAAGCQGDRVYLPQGQVPPLASPADVTAAGKLDAPRPTLPPPAGERMTLPPAFPGSDAPPVRPLRLPKDATPAQRDAALRDSYPPVAPVSAELPAEGRPLTLAELQAFALANNPAIRRAQADADAAYGTVVQQGLHPNPTVGYQADQIQPGLRGPVSGAGQQGGFVSQLIKTAGKLRLQQLVAGFDYLNAVVAVRRAEVDVLTQVRSAYFGVLVARQGVEVNAALAALADEAYRLQLKQVAAGEAAGYEPLQLHAQAVLARNAVTQAEAQYRAGWRQLAAALGRPDLPAGALAGRADVPPPALDPDAVLARAREHHTDVLAARNSQAQATANLDLQRRIPYPDVETNTYQQFDNAARQYQFGVQVGVQLPISDRNQGNIRQAQARIHRAAENVLTVQNELTARLADARNRLEANRAVAANFRDQIIPSLTRAYRAQLTAYQVTPEQVGFTDLVVSQQLLGTQLQAYLAALAAQWQAVVDVAAIGQLDDLYPAGP
jgi:cobalt-zinc-cadmium efflux system outer membrane protein